MLQAIINFFKKLFGMADDPAGAALDQVRHSQSNVLKGAEAITGDVRVRMPGEVIKEEKGACLWKDEDDGELMWSNTWNKEVKIEDWVDEWGPCDPKDVDTFWGHKYSFDMALAGDPMEAEAKIQAHGYRDVGHFYQVELSMLKYFHQPDPSATMLEDVIWDQSRASKAAMAGMKDFQANQHAAAVAANPELMAPVEGVDVDTYALIAAKCASGLPQDEQIKLLGEHGMDLAKWERVNAEWTDRMSKDTSGAIAMAYSKGFGAAGAGQYGAAGAAGMDALGSRGTNAAGGDEPVSFERYCEIQGAQTAWAESGQDVNAMLKHAFNMTAQDWSTMSMWWMAKMQSEIELFTKHSELCDKYKEQYLANSGIDKTADDDLSF